uniref:Exosome component 1 n=1 Tax=Anolis carolinensis TaxID=28377 RepID=A0A803TZ16_ANOCA
MHAACSPMELRFPSCPARRLILFLRHFFLSRTSQASAGANQSRDHEIGQWEVRRPGWRECVSLMAPARCCVPGERLCSLEEGVPGSGTYTRHGFIFASLAGCLVRKSENGTLPVISVMRDVESQLLPDVGATVTCKVCSINSRFAKVHILYVGSSPLKTPFRGTIRREDIRATEKDKISLGDAQSNYLLTTAENELGVVVAHSEAGVQMVPISWCEMQCPSTHGKELRKVARVQPQFLQT